MWRTVALAKARGVAVGAHPGFPDPSGSAAAAVATPREVEDFCSTRWPRWPASPPRKASRFSTSRRTCLPTWPCVTARLADAIARAVAAFDRSLVLLGLPDSELLLAGQAHGLPIAAEVFADRAYEPDGSLASRRKAGSVIHDTATVVARAVRMVRSREVVATDGTTITLRADTMCLHGDTPGSGDLARQIRTALEAAGASVVALCGPVT